MPHIVSSKQDLGYASSGTGSCSILDQIGTHPNYNQNEKVLSECDLCVFRLTECEFFWLTNLRYRTIHDWWLICDN